jgi:hypothetical protein
LLIEALAPSQLRRTHQQAALFSRSRTFKGIKFVDELEKDRGLLALHDQVWTQQAKHIACADARDRTRLLLPTVTIGAYLVDFQVPVFFVLRIPMQPSPSMTPARYASFVADVSIIRETSQSRHVVNMGL